MKKEKLVKENLHNLNRLHKREILKRNIAYAVSAASGTLALLGAFTFFGSTASYVYRQSKLNAGYEEFNKNFKLEQKEILKERVFNKELNIDDYAAKVENLSDFDKDTYYKNFADPETQEKYQNINQDYSNMLKASAGLVATLPLVFTEIIGNHFDKNAENIMKEIETKEKLK